jgi:hypothetical protein
MKTDSTAFASIIVKLNIGGYGAVRTEQKTVIATNTQGLIIQGSVDPPTANIIFL